MKRRKFLQALTLFLVSGKIIHTEVKDFIKKNTRWKIFNELPKHVYMANYEGITEKDKKVTQEGVGIIYDQKFISVAHIIGALEKEMFMSPFGMFSENVKLKEKYCKVNGKKLPILIEDQEQDVFIADAGRLNLPDFPCKPNKRRNLGDRVYIIGNPQLSGQNIREGIISDLDRFGEQHFTKYCFGTNIPVIGGDSGSPLIDENYNLKGLARTNAGNILSYVTKIENLINYKPMVKQKIDGKKD